MQTKAEREQLNGKMIFNGKKAVVLAHGESGHAHAFYGEDTVELDGSILIVKATDALSHEEHASHVIEPGIGEVIIQREYKREEIQRVFD